MAKILTSPGKYVQGAGELKKLGTYAKTYGKKALVLVTASGHKRLGTTLEDSFRDSGCEPVLDYFNGECSKTEINRLNAENVASGDAAASVSETNSTIASEADNGSTAESGSEDVSGTDAENTGASKAESVSNENADSESVSAELQSQQSGAE